MDVRSSGQKMLRAAVIGVGFVGPHHVDAIRRTGYADVVALGGTDERRLALRAAALGVARATRDMASIMADQAIDVVHICTPNASHVELARAVLEAGKHVVVEKPVALDSPSAEGLVALAAARRRHALVAFTYRGYPMVRRARDLVRDGQLGSLRLIHGQYLQDWLSEESDYNWRVDPMLGGASRAVADIGCHWFDTVEFVSGRRVEAVFADLATMVPARDRPVDAAAVEAGAEPATRVAVGNEDAAVILVRFEGGPIGSCVVSQVSPGHKNDLVIELAGQRRSLCWRQESPERLWLGARGSAETLVRAPDELPRSGVPALPAGHPEGWGEALSDLLRPFYAAIARDEEPPSADTEAGYPTLVDGARAVRFVEAVLVSAREQRWVSLVGAESTFPTRAAKPDRRTG